MNKWTETDLESLLIDFESGKRPKGGVRGIRNGIPSLGGEHLKSNGLFNLKNIKYVPENFANNMKKGHIKLKDLLIVKDGATTGKISFVDKNFPFNNAVINEHLFRCHVSKKINSKFVFYFLYSGTGQKRILSNFKGTAQGGINTSFAPNTLIPIAPMNEQNRIVEKIEELFSDLDKATEDLKKIREQLKVYQQAVLKAAFEGKLTEEWRRKNMLLISLDNLSKEIGVGVSELNCSYIKNIPQKWILTKINRICNVVRGGSPRPMGDPKYFNGNIPFIKIGDITKLSSKYVLNSKTKVNKQGAKKSRLLSKGSLILSNSGTICIPKFLGVDACIHDGFVSFKDLPEYIDVNFLFEFFNYIRPYVIQKNKQGVTQVNLNTEIVGDIDLLIPAKEEQEQIINEIESRLSVCNKIEEIIEQSLNKIEYLRQSILKKAFEGKLVPQDPNDELAEKLLERIKQEKKV